MIIRILKSCSRTWMSSPRHWISSSRTPWNEKMVELYAQLWVIFLQLIPVVGVIPFPISNEGSDEKDAKLWTEAELLSLQSRAVVYGSDNIEEKSHRSRRQVPVDADSVNSQLVAVTLVVIMILMIAVIVVAVLIGVFLCRQYDLAVEASETPYWKTPGEPELLGIFSFGGMSRKMAYSAQMYHYEQQKRRIIEEEKAASEGSPPTDVASDEESNAETYVIYEYPGLASTEGLEVRNPLFNEDLLLALSNMKNKKQDDEDHANSTTTEPNGS